MARAWREKTVYNVPIVAHEGISHYLPVEIEWLKVLMDDGYLNVAVGQITITEPNYGEA